MNYRRIFNMLGTILMTEAALLLLPVAVAIYYGELNVILPFAVTIGLLTGTAMLMKIKKPSSMSIFARDGYMLVALSWLFLSAFGALPFVISKSIPNFIDAFFETVSGFTTTGSTILAEVAHLPKSILFWRSFTHFIGGMGILVFVIAILPKTDGTAMHIMRAEVPGPTVGKLVSKLRASARILYGIYTGMTLLLTVLLIIGGMPKFDSLLNAFATAGTGGFSILNDGIGGYHSPYAEVVISIFMMLFGLNFNLYYLILIRQGRSALKDEELHWYTGIIAGATLIFTIYLTVLHHPFGESLRLSFFQVCSIISTTGFTTADFNVWPVATRIILLILMFVGGCVGSTGGGLKVSRIAVLVKNSVRLVRRAINPRRCDTIKINGRPVDDHTVHGITGYFATFMLVLVVSVFIVSIDGHELTATITSVITCLANVGPGLGEIGPTGNFSGFSILSKVILSFDMLAGRLELIPIFMLFTKYAIPRKYA